MYDSLLDAIRWMSDTEITALIMILGMIGWFILIFAFLALSKLWDRLSESSVYQCARLRRENARLRKKLREAHHVAKQ